MEKLKKETSKLKTTKVGGFTLLPPAKDVCQECATKHEPHEPHNAESLYYQCVFYAEHGRYPVWKDAIAHCSEELKAAWMKELKERGVWVD